MNKTLFLGIIKDGGLDFGSEYNQIRFRQYLKDNPGKKLEIHLREPVRSLQQNRLYWLYLEEIERETGNSANDLHEYFKRTHLPPEFITVLGKEIKIPASTTALTKMKFCDYMEKILAECGVEMPDAEKYNEWKNSAPLVTSQKC